MKTRLFLSLALALPLPLLAANSQVLSWNNLGMHCMDSDYSVFSVLPPYNTIEAQLIVNGALVTNAPSVNPNLPNGITIFPGGFPLYRNGALIGAVGVSGDGIDQDDLISASGASLFLAPVPIRADETQYRGARLPFAKFPRNPAM